MQYLKEILFIDIETVPIQPDYELLNTSMQTEWARKAKFVKSVTEGVTDPATLFSEKAGVFSEFAKIVCIGFGSLNNHDGTWKMRLKAIANDNEKILLEHFCETLAKFNSLYPDLKFCGHNIREFDIPFICRRMLINSIGLPPCLDISGKKPWEINHLDTMELWKFGDYKHFTPLSLLATIFGIPSPKSDIDGSMVSSVYWKDKDLARIAAYCLQDVYTTAKVFLKLKGINDIEITPEYVNA
ncbi:MAG: polymerase elongation subunit [Flavipsychrobacter sp.]|jgi:DNA polymerase elongation subunit (family B)|nr:polymerase elongation subunit [Flavipsychrobacter sp.]